MLKRGKREEQHKNRKRHHSRKLKRFHLKCAKRLSRMCDCSTDLLYCKPNKSEMTKSIRDKKYELSNMQVNCKSLCDAFTCREIHEQTTNTTKMNMPMFSGTNVTTKSDGTTISMYTAKNITSESDNSPHLKGDEELNSSYSRIAIIGTVISFVLPLLLIWSVCHLRCLAVSRKKAWNKKSQNDHESLEQTQITHLEYTESKTFSDFRRNHQRKSSSSYYSMSEVWRRSISDGIDKRSIDLFPGSLLVDENEGNVKESALTVEQDVRVSIVRPLTGPIDEQNGENTSDRLNWDEIFRYLAKNLPTNDYKLFFNILYGNCHHLLHEGRDPGSIIEKVEHNVRRDCGDSETLIFELFKTWKQLMGKSVSIACIEQALSERSNNLALQRFREFMRTPPLLPSISDLRQYQLVHPEIMHQNKMTGMCQYYPRNELTYTNYMLPNMPPFGVLPPANRAIDIAANGPVIEEVEDHDMISLASFSNSSSSLSERSSAMSYGDKNVRRKRLGLTRDTVIYGNEERPRKVRKTNDSMVQTKRRSRQARQRKETTTAIELYEMRESIISLTKQFLPLSPMPLQAKQYDVFLEYTIDSITKQTGKSRHLILSLSHDSYRKIETFKTKRNDVIYVIYAGASILVLENSEFENLRLYADFARRNLVRELSERLGDEYQEPEDLFLAYDGRALLKKKKVVRHFKERTEQTVSSSFAGNPPQRFTIVSESESTVDENRTNKEKPNDDVFGEEFGSTTSSEGTASSVLNKISNTVNDSSAFADDKRSMLRTYQVDKYKENNVSAERKIMDLNQAEDANCQTEKSVVLPFIEIDESSKHVKPEAVSSATTVVFKLFKEIATRTKSLPDASFDENSPSRSTLMSEQSEATVVEKEGNKSNTNDSDVDMSRKEKESTNSLGATPSYVLDKTSNIGIASSTSPSSSPSFTIFAKRSQKSRLSNYIKGKDSYDETAKRKIVHLHDAVKTNVDQCDVPPCGKIGVFFVSKEPGTNVTKEVFRPYKKRIKQTGPLFDENSLSSSLKFSNQSESTSNNNGVTILKPNAPEVDVFSKKRDFSTTFASSSLNKNSSTDMDNSFATAAKHFEKRMPTQHFEDDINKNVFVKNAEGKLFHLNDSLEVRNISRVDETIKSGVVKGKADGCNPCSELNYQQTIDAKTCSTLNEITSCEFENKIIFACILSLIQSESSEERKCLGTNMAIDLD